jgi:hypothetical protein
MKKRKIVSFSFQKISRFPVTSNLTAHGAVVSKCISWEELLIGFIEKSGRMMKTNAYILSSSERPDNFRIVIYCSCSKLLCFGSNGNIYKCAIWIEMYYCIVLIGIHRKKNQSGRWFYMSETQNVSENALNRTDIHEPALTFFWFL